MLQAVMAQSTAQLGGMLRDLYSASVPATYFMLGILKCAPGTAPRTCAAGRAHSAHWQSRAARPAAPAAAPLPALLPGTAEHSWLGTEKVVTSWLHSFAVPFMASRAVSSTAPAAGLAPALLPDTAASFCAPHTVDIIGTVCDASGLCMVQQVSSSLLAPGQMPGTAARLRDATSTKVRFQLSA